MSHTFSLLLWLNRSKADKAGEAPVYARITVNGERSEISTGQKLAPERWNAQAGRARGQRDDAVLVNTELDKLRLKISQIYQGLREKEAFISASQIKEIYLGGGAKSYTLLEVFQHHNQQMKAQVGTDYAEATYQRYETCYRLTKEYIQHQYKRSDINLAELKHGFITGFEFYLKTVRSNNHNTTIKYLRNFKKIVHLALANGWLEKNPFLAYKAKIREVKREVLSRQELEQLERVVLPGARLKMVRDVFVFCCYTGLAYADVAALAPANISVGIDGGAWLFVDRKKTGVSSKVPLLPKAEAILEEYDKHPEVKEGKLLPMLSNQKMNSYLKDVAKVSGLSKRLTFHVARHTFATTVTLTNGVPIESVSAMLGHKNLKTTQIYAKVIEQKISEDMQKLRSKLLPQDVQQQLGSHGA